MSLFSKAILMALPILLCCGRSGDSQPSAPVSSGTREIAGVVLSARTGLPVRDAEVTLRRTKDSSLLAQTATDTEGRFSFREISNDKYSLQASHRGYITAAYDEHENGSTAIVTGEGLVSTGLRFMLAPQAVIFGVVSDDAGDPIPGAAISLYRQNVSVGAGKAIRASGAGADEVGNYEIAHLPPGNYFLSVTATPWYAARPSARNVAGDRAGAGGANVQPRSPLDVAYPVTYYPDVADSSFAVPIAVSAGERVQINVTLHPVPALHALIQIPSHAPDGQFSTPQLSREVFGYPDSVQANMSIATHGGSPGSITTFEISGIAPGAYDVELAAPNGESNRAASVDLNSDQAIDVSSAAALADVSGKIVMAGGENPPSSLYIALTPQQGQNQNGAPLEPDGSFHMRSVHPGTYEVAVFAQGYPMTTTRLIANGATLKGHLLTLGSEPVTLTAVVTESTATVNGFATLDGKPASGIFLELVPKDPAAGRTAMGVNQSDSDGSFNFLHTLPGEYTLVAIQEGWTLDWAAPGAMAPYLAKGLKVVVPPHSQEINLKSSVEVQPK